MNLTRCLACGFESDDHTEAVTHLTGHHPLGCTCGPCEVVYGRARTKFVDVDWHAFDIWLEGAA